MKTLFGIPVITNDLLDKDWQKIKLRDDLMITDECRDRVNKYLLDMFGTERRVFMFNGKVLMSPRDMVLLRASV